MLIVLKRYGTLIRLLIVVSGGSFNADLDRNGQSYYCWSSLKKS